MVSTNYMNQFLPYLIAILQEMAQVKIPLYEQVTKNITFSTLRGNNENGATW